jgi:predicted transcriptional regulator
MDIKDRRSKYEIIYDILSTLLESPLHKTLLIYNAKVDTRQAKRYLNYLLMLGLIEYVQGEKIIRITDKGRRYLQLYKEISDLLKRQPSN